MKALPGILDSFISPMTGKMSTDGMLPDLQKDYVWTGDRKNIAGPSPALLDLRLDLIYLKSQITDFTRLSDGILKIQSHIPVIATPNIDYLTPDLMSGKIWLGDSQNKVAQVSRLGIDNLPIFTSLNPFRKIWRAGLTSSIPEESDSLTVLEGIVTAATSYLYNKVKTAPFILKSGSVVDFPNATFLTLNEPGLMKLDDEHDVVQAIAGQDYLTMQAGFGDADQRNVPIIMDNFNIKRSHVRFMEFDNASDEVFGIHNLTCDTTTAQHLRSQHEVFGATSAESRSLLLYDYDEINRYTRYATIRGPYHYAVGNNQLVYNLAFQGSSTGQVLMDVGPELLDDSRNLAFKDILDTNLQNNLLAKAVVNNRPIFANATLTANNIWIGDANNAPRVSNVLGARFYVNQAHADLPNAIVTDMDAQASKTAPYILQYPVNGYDNAQNLSTVNAGMMKLTQNIGQGKSFSYAVPNTDYTTPARLEERATEILAEVDAAIAAVTGYATLTALTAFLSSILTGITYDTYKWRSMKPLLSRNKTSSTDSEKFPGVLDWASDAYGGGNIFYDSHPDSSGANWEAGLRLTSWNSSIFSSSDLKPVSMGLYGFQRSALDPQGFQGGFCFRSDIETDSDHTNYAFAKNFVLYRALHREQSIGFQTLDRLWGYDHYTQQFDTYKPHKFREVVSIDRDPTEALHAANKKFVDTQINSIKTLTLTGDVSASGTLGSDINTTIASSIHPNFMNYNVNYPIPSSLYPDQYASITHRVHKDSNTNRANFKIEVKKVEVVGGPEDIDMGFKANLSDSNNVIGFYAKNENNDQYILSVSTDSSFKPITNIDSIVLLKVFNNTDTVTNPQEGMIRLRRTQ